MKSYEIDQKLSRILCGYLFYGKHKIIQPDQELLYRAFLLYGKVYEKCLEDGIKEDCQEDLVDCGIWTKEMETNLKEILPRHVEEWKVSIYENRFQSKKQASYRELLRKSEKELVRLLSIRHSYDHFTCAGIANYAKRSFICKNVCKTVSSDKIMNFLEQENIGERDYRQIVKSDRFSMLWSAHKRSRCIKSKTEEQQQLLMWASLYDSLRKMPECTDDVLKDDDCLDGFMILRRRENKPKIEIGKEGSEVFLPADNVSDAMKIYDMNDAEGRRVQRERFNQISKQGEVKEWDLPDVKRKIQMEFNKMSFQK